jgi:hypothetical protein
MAPGGRGKSSLDLVEFVSMSIGRELLVPGPDKPAIERAARPGITTGRRTGRR